MSAAAAASLLRSLALLSCASVAAQAPEGPKVDFARDILPVLRTKCFDCHSATRADGSRRDEPKGGLRLDGRAWIERGGDGEDAIVGADLEASAVYSRTILPSDDSDFMPSKGDGLTDEEKQSLRAWILAGADFGDWVGAEIAEGEATSRPSKDRPLHIPARHKVLRELEQRSPLPGPAPLDQIAAAVAQQVQIRPVLEGSALLRVSFRSHEGATNDATLRKLAGIAPWIAVLDLGRTRVTDASAKTLSAMPRLTRLDLSRSGVGDGIAKALGGLEELRWVNLYGTDLTDRGLLALAKAPRLSRVFTWQTAVTPEGAKAVAPLDVVRAPSWPR